MSLSEQLYYGEIAPCEHTVPDTPEWKELGKQRSAEEHEILADMSEAQRERYDRVCETISRLNALETEKVFVSAFILGARMMLEILNAAGEELSSEFIIPHPRAKCKQNFREKCGGPRGKMRGKPRAPAVRLLTTAPLPVII